MSIRLKQKLTPVDRRHGILQLTKEVYEHFPTKQKMIDIFFDNSKTNLSKNCAIYAQNNRRITGLTVWFKHHEAFPGDIVDIEVLKPKQSYRFKLKKSEIHTKKVKHPYKQDSPPKSSEDTAQGWYSELILTILSTPNIKRKFETVWGPPKWTKFFIDFLAEWGRKQGYEVQPAPGNPYGIDLKWSTESGTYLALEHENNGDNIDDLKSEIEKLQSIDAKLKVLITYVKDKYFPEKCRKLAVHIKEKLKNTQRIDSEFLLIVGPWHIKHPSEYACFLFKPIIEYTAIFPAYSEKAT